MRALRNGRQLPSSCNVLVLQQVLDRNALCTIVRLMVLELSCVEVQWLYQGSWAIAVIALAFRLTGSQVEQLC